MATKKAAVKTDDPPKELEGPEPLKRKCEIAQMLPVGVLQLLASAPHNETVRHVLLAHLKRSVPEELKTYKDIQDWIEFNFDPPSVPIGKQKAVPGQNVIEVLVVAHVEETGSCSYHERQQGRGNMRIRLELLTDIASEADDVDEFWEEIRTEFYDQGVRDYISLETVEGSQNHSDYEPSGDDDSPEIEITRDGYEAIKQALRTFNPAEYDRLFS
jgi:hypothetical protein